MGADEIGRAVGTLLNRRKVAKHYHHRQRAELMHDHAAITAEAAFAASTCGAPVCQPPVGVSYARGSSYRFWL